METIIKSDKELFMEQLFIKYKTKVNEHSTRTHHIYLEDISTIDGIGVDVYIHNVNNGDLLLSIESNTIYVNGERINLYNSGRIELKWKKGLHEFQEAFEKIIMILQQLSFDKISSKFVEKKTFYATQIFPELVTIGKAISNIEDCCVCYEKTRRQTPCCHTLCIPCWSKIKPVNNIDDEDEYKITPCPLCRKDISQDEEDEGN